MGYSELCKPLLVEELAQLPSMGVSTLHHHFRMLTSMLRFTARNKGGCFFVPDVNPFDLLVVVNGVDNVFSESPARP